VTLRVEAEGRVSVPPRQYLGTAKGDALVGQQFVHTTGGTISAAVFDRARLGAGDRFAGPAIVTQLDATTWVAPEWNAEVLLTGALRLRRGSVR